MSGMCRVRDWNAKNKVKKALGTQILLVLTLFQVAVGLELSSCAAPQTQSDTCCFSLNLNHLLVSGFLGGKPWECFN